MNSNSVLNDLLSQLKQAALATKFSKENLITAMKNLLLWLNWSENNTDSNCKEIDYYISSEIIPEKNFQDIPEDVGAILFDMGATLHDTHTSPDVAINFESTPSELLKRVQDLASHTSNFNNNKE